MKRFMALMKLLSRPKKWMTKMSDFRTFVALGMAAPLAKEVDAGIQNGGENAVQKNGGDASETVVIPCGGTAAVAQKNLSDARYLLPAYGATPDGSKTSSALNAVAAQLDPLGCTAVEMPKGAEFVLDYNQKDAQNASMAILLSDTPKNTGSNKRQQAVNPSWGSPYMFGQTVHASDLPNFTAACNNGSATVLIMGDSIMNAGANLANPQQCAWEFILGEIKKANPTVTLTDWNMTWGGQRWSQMASSTNGGQLPNWLLGRDGVRSWLQICLDYKPNLVFLYSGGNDEGSLNPADVVTVVNAFKAINCDVILCETFQPANGSLINDYYQEAVQDGVHFSRRFITTYAQANGIAYLPFGRWCDMIRDGFDSEILTMPENNATPGTGYPARYETVPDSALRADSSGGSVYAFPDIPNMFGVSSALCTDWCLGATHTGINTSELGWRFCLSAATDKNYDNSLWVFFNRPNIWFQITDCAGGKITIGTNVPVPRGKWSFWVMARGAHLVFAMRLHYTSSGIENSIGLGYTKILDTIVPRCGSPYLPWFASTNVSLSGTLSIDALCSADATRADGGGQRYRPVVNSRALYYDTEILASDGVLWQPNMGGSDWYHLNGAGAASLLYRVIAAQDWRATTGLTVAANRINAPQGYLTTANMKTDGFMKANQGIGAWGNNPPANQPVITGTKPTDPIVQQILAAGNQCGLFKDNTA